ncbi:MAG: hypothetical protein DSM107014_06905 [Gomphosphaeria aponina SAG 52.96 = DSM 107014]|uniref:Uncharacterized protein n=1 Tax=Gomphosphaeria aponina SAG 52.96 = DSM 107014 TaxID=1521640 RepID=A0A941GT31_9CHRO|nr:hypothetical protein [Gomphosphaeria aponina SAG 52.96 = DSM 107014]
MASITKEAKRIVEELTEIANIIADRLLNPEEEVVHYSHSRPRLNHQPSKAAEGF